MLQFLHPIASVPAESHEAVCIVRRDAEQEPESWAPVHYRGSPHGNVAKVSRWVLETLEALVRDLYVPIGSLDDSPDLAEIWIRWKYVSRERADVRAELDLHASMINDQQVFASSYDSRGAKRLRKPSTIIIEPHWPKRKKYPIIVLYISKEEAA